LHIDSIAKGGLIEVEVRCNGKSVNFKSEVAHIINNSILIAPIKVNEQTIGFSDQCQINFLYVYEGKLFIWENITVKLVKYDGAIYHKIDIYGDGKTYNRRDSYRMYIGEDMPVYVNTASGPTALSVLVKDISETGVGFITKDDIDVDRTVRFKLKDNNTILSLSGVIVRKEFLSSIGSFLYGVRFNEKNDKLSRYIAKKQGEALRKKNVGNTPLPRETASKLKITEIISK
jgi:c-di-GMP-binding flagellar brake protein YcgR